MSGPGRSRPTQQAEQPSLVVRVIRPMALDGADWLPRSSPRHHSLSMDATVEPLRPLAPFTQCPTPTSVHPSVAAGVLPRTAVRHDAVPAFGGTVAAAAAGCIPLLLLIVAVTSDAGVDTTHPPRRRRRPAPRGQATGAVPPRASLRRRGAAAPTLSQLAGGAAAGAAARGGEGGGGLVVAVWTAVGGRLRRLFEPAGRGRRRARRRTAARGRAARCGGVKEAPPPKGGTRNARRALVSILLIPRLKRASDEAQMRLPLIWPGNAAFLGCLGHPLRVFIVHSRRVGP